MSSLMNATSSSCLPGLIIGGAPPQKNKCPQIPCYHPGRLSVVHGACWGNGETGPWNSGHERQIVSLSLLENMDAPPLSERSALRETRDTWPLSRLQGRFPCFNQEGVQRGKAPAPTSESFPTPAPFPGLQPVQPGFTPDDEFASSFRGHDYSCQHSNRWEGDGVVRPGGERVISDGPVPRPGTESRSAVLPSPARPSLRSPLSGRLTVGCRYRTRANRLCI